MLHSLLIANDPAHNLEELLNKIAVESNSGVYKDIRSLWQSATKMAEQQQQPVNIISSTRNNNLSSLLDRINTRGGRRQQQTSTNTTGSSSRYLTLGTNARAIDFSSKLIDLLQDGSRTNRNIQQQHQQQQKQQMIPRFIVNDMPKPLSGEDFTSGQVLYVPVNPRDFLSNIQWLDVLSAVEFETRSVVSDMEIINSERNVIDSQLHNLLTNWNATVAGDTGEWDTELVIEEFE
ncbi:hypothetical protein Pcinc_000587 [Petrolisthes cinctipes]|uniref:Uncharacterized protein n=1 Tax=Petrolisthes cinctipes TaxID=88211 RepID=A0AAE1GME7_PETCI|nr:hypothetical protein Pcinc_000587 [Petrolisthes cinctipes]